MTTTLTTENGTTLTVTDAEGGFECRYMNPDGDHFIDITMKGGEVHHSAEDDTAATSAERAGMSRTIATQNADIIELHDKVAVLTRRNNSLRSSNTELRDKSNIPAPPERTGPDLSEPWTPTPDTSILSAIQEALGTASLCWENTEEVGMFQTDKALWVATGLHDYLIALTAEAQEAGRVTISGLITHRDRLLKKQADAKIDNAALLKRVKELEARIIVVKGDGSELSAIIGKCDATIKELRDENHQLKDDALETRMAEAAADNPLIAEIQMLREEKRQLQEEVRTLKGSPDPWFTIGNLIDRLDALEADMEEL